MAIRHVFLDWNGTHIDDFPQAHVAANAVLRSCKLGLVSQNDFLHTIIARSGDWYAFFQQNGVSLSRDEMRKIYIPAYLEQVKNIVCIKGVRETIQILHKKGIRIHLLTAAQRELVHPVLRTVGLRALHHEMHFGVHDKASCMRNILSARGISQHEVAHVGDLPSDVMAGVCTGIHSIGLRTGHVPEKFFTRVRGPWYYAHSWRDIAKYVLAI